MKNYNSRAKMRLHGLIAMARLKWLSLKLLMGLAFVLLIILTGLLVVFVLPVMWIREKLRKSSNTSTSESVVEESTPITVELIRSIEDISVYDYIKCAVNGDMNSLILLGEPSENELSAAFMGLQSQYFELIKSPEAAQYVRNVSRMQALQLKISTVRTLTVALALRYDERLAASLQKIGYQHIQFSEETLNGDLNRVLTELGNDDVRLAKYKAEFDRTQAENENKGATTKEDLMKIFYAICKHRQMHHNPKKMSLYEFGMGYNELQDYADYLKTLNNGGK